METQQALQQAFEHLNDGNLAAASKLFENVLRHEPRNISALNGRGYVFLQQNHLPQSAADFQKSLALNPNQHFAHKMLGIVQGVMDQLDASLKSFAAALALDSKDPEVFFNRANLLFQAGLIQEALADLDAAIRLRDSYLEARSNRANILIRLGDFGRAEVDLEFLVANLSNNADIWVALGLVKHRLGQWSEAVRCNDRALSLVPNHPDALLNSSSLAYDDSNYLLALSWAENAIKVTPNRAEAHYALAQALYGLSRFENSVISYKKAINFNPSYVEAWLGQGIAYASSLRYTEAIESCRSALRVSPANSDAYVNLGFILREKGDFDSALDALNKAIKLDPKNLKAYNNLGLLHMITRDPTSSLRAFDNGLAVLENDPSILFSKSATLLALGDYENGWKLYESRNLKRIRPRKFSKPLWIGGESVSDLTVLIHSEQGLGDTLQFCRYVNLMAKKCKEVLLLVQKPLKNICKTLNTSVVVLSEGEPIPEFDVHVPMMSLPLALGTTVESIPCQAPYLFADEARSKIWRDKLNAYSGLKVGLVWNGGFRPNDPNDWAVNARRNISIDRFKSLETIGIQFVSLQKGEPARSEFLKLQEQDGFYRNILDFDEQLKDFTDTASLVSELDLVITVDTSVAHLAGALGKPLWLLNRYDSCWRWFVDRMDSPWYPSARIYNQTEYGNWDSVIERVRDDLRRVVSQKEKK